jgi:hypothetical protein
MSRTVLPQLWRKAGPLADSEERGGQQRSVEKARRHVQKMTNPKSTSVTREVKTFAKDQCTALAAFIIGFIRAPEDVPSANPAEAILRII